MVIGAQDHTDDIEKWQEMCSVLCKLKISIEYAQEFAKKFSKYMGPTDRVKIAEYNTKCDELYWKQFQRMINIMRGII